MRIGSIGRIIVVALAVSVAAAGCGKAVGEPSVDELLSLGEKYLAELDYEQALARFLQVIELEPRRVEAYLGAADAYGGMGALDEAVAILERGLELTGDERLRERLGALLAADTAQEADPVAQTLYNLLAGGDNEAAYAYCLSEEFLAACASLGEDAFRRYGEDGAAVAYYPYRYVYFGEWKDGVREGVGLYFEVGDSGRSFYEGEWRGDLPNGEQVYTSYYSGEKDINVEYRLEGTCVDGKFHGQVIDESTSASGEVHHWVYQVNNGIAVAIGDVNDRGVHPIARCNDCNVSLFHLPDTPVGIPPFDKRLAN